jgi:hypothetical protein
MNTTHTSIDNPPVDVAQAELTREQIGHLRNTPHAKSLMAHAQSIARSRARQRTLGRVGLSRRY